VSDIHSTAIIDPSAEIEPGACIGPYCILGRNVRIGAGTVLHAHVVIEQNTRIGRNCQIYSGAVLGGPPQDFKYSGEPTYIEIGDDNILREGVTIHRATGEGNETRVGSGNMLMAYAHVGHNCEIGNNVTIASYVGISGHVTVEDHANFGGHVGVHQYSRIGTLAMVGGMSGVAQDIPPYMLAAGIPATVCEVNRRGLIRAEIPQKIRNELRQAYKLLYRSNLNISQALEAIAEDIERSPALDHLVEFVRSSRDGYSGRGNNPKPR
jgi:UDP-N-acetylglucosamine acyltransferase